MEVFKNKGRYIFIVLVLIIGSAFKSAILHAQNKVEKTVITDLTTRISLADPTIFHYKGTYYLYGTGESNGFLVYTSPDMKTWKGPAGVKDGYALFRNDAFGSRGFWAPQIFSGNNRFYMAYTANENIAIAESKSPLGPFTQVLIKPISGKVRQIDPFVFIDDDGKKYLYHVRVEKGNRIFVAEMKDDFSNIKPETLKECIRASETWENTARASWPVTEGPTVMKHKHLYYLFYSANDFRNIDYAVGYAVAPTPYGPWKKFNGNPVISRHNTGKNGAGHGDLIKDHRGDWHYVLHVHSNQATFSRVLGLVKIKFVGNGSEPDKVVMEANSFSYLNLLR